MARDLGKVKRGTPKRTYDPVQTQQSILDAGVVLFGRQGFHSTSVREIVELAGMTKGAFYHHFDSKEALLYTIHEQFINFHLAGQSLIVSRVENAHERLFHLVRMLVLVVAKYREQVSVFYQEQRALAGQEFSDMHAKRVEARDGFTESIAAGVANGEFRADVDPAVAALGILGMGNWMYQWYTSSTPTPVEVIGETYALMAVRSVTNKPQLVQRLQAGEWKNDDPVEEVLRMASLQNGTGS